MDKKIALPEILQFLIGNAIKALAKLITSKLLPKAQEKYCKVLQATSEKIIEAATKVASQLATEEDEKKKIKKLYLLDLILKTTDAVAEALRAFGDHIRDTVDFTPIIVPDENARIALADIPGALEDEGGCGPDGCMIA